MAGTADHHEQSHWLEVIGCSLAYLCLHFAKLGEENLASQASFLQRLGLTRKESAKILNTTEDSLEVLLRRARKSKGAKRGKTKTKRHAD